MKGPGAALLLLAVAGTVGLSPLAGAPGGTPEAEADDAQAPDPWLTTVFLGPESGTDAADPYEDVAGAATGAYVTQASSSGYGRLTGSIWLYPSVCAQCEFATPHGTTRERGLLTVQYSFASKDGAPFTVALSGDVDWEIEFDHDVSGLAFTTNDPYGPPLAQRLYSFKHEARASVGNDFEYERSLNVYAPVNVDYDVVPLTVPGGPSEAEPPLRTFTIERLVPDGFVRLTYVA